MHVAFRQCNYLIQKRFCNSSNNPGRNRLHFLYKILRSTHPTALYNEFRSINEEAAHQKDSPLQSYELTQKHALEKFEEEMAEYCSNPSQQLDLAVIMCKSAALGHDLVVRKILSISRTLVNQSVSGGATPLYLAASRGEEAIVRILLNEHGVKPNPVTDYSNETPLFIASARGYVSTVQSLLAHPEIDVNIAREDRTTPLHVAAQHGHIDIVTMLLSAKNINVNVARLSDEATPLITAICHGHSFIVRHLCAKVVFMALSLSLV